MTPRFSHFWLPAAAFASLAGAALACPPGSQKKDNSTSQFDVTPDSIRANSVRTDSPRSSSSSDRLKSAQSKFRKMVLEQFDANHNGRLDSKERQAANRALSGKGDSAAIEALQKEALTQFDTNHNGKLEKTEIHKALNTVNPPNTTAVAAKATQPTRTATAQLQQQLLYNGVNTTSSQIQTLENLLASNSGTLSSSEVALIQSLLSQLLTQNSTSSTGTGFLPAAVTTTTPTTTTTGSGSTTGSGMCSGSSSSSSSGTSSGSTTSSTRSANTQNTSGQFLSSAGGLGAGGAGFGGSGGGFRGGFRGR